MSYQLIDYITIYAKEWDNLVTEFLRHLAMTSFAVIFALLLAVPLGILITHSKLLSKNYHWLCQYYAIDSLYGITGTGNSHFACGGDSCHFYGICLCVSSYSEKYIHWYF